MEKSAPRRIVLGVTGGIAAYKAAELVRILVQDGTDVRVVMTQAACGFIAPATFQALSGNPVFTDMWDSRIANGMAHIDLSRGVDAIVIAPATADFLAKLAYGFADDLLSTLCLARPRAGQTGGERDCPLLVAPAMNRQMWENPATQRNIAQIATDGIIVFEPASGEQACGEIGYGRMLEAQQIYEELNSALQPKLLSGKTVLITAGPTFEAIDAVRGITNRSSGRMGYAIARAAIDAGAHVTLITGPTNLAVPLSARTERVESANEMFDAVKKHVGQADIFVGVAAVADYRVEKASEQKIKKTDSSLQLKLIPNPDILAWVAALPNPPFCVGFAAESEKLEQYADEKRRRKNIPLLAANLAQKAIGAEDNELILFDDAGTHKLRRAPKAAVARELIEHLVKLYGSSKQLERKSPGDKSAPRQ